ncbi:hypothetical protein LG198_00280 [Methylobacillus arboreus]|uniref:hypothetical protein n=1 Tax=Methylobacillus arboreus TaxID=755170 RepID=UPI001E5F72CA|nr:hypothetical protein [Methylobacillus arboreus]MCB5189170.1 hypothetical protein [Methylobacillus arboreus]
MKLQIYLSGIPESLDAIATDDALLRLLARGRVQWLEDEWEASLCRGFGIARQQDWPLAALARLGQGMPVDDAYWLLASPVNLFLQRDSFLLNQPAPLPLTSAEDEALRESLNRHFSGEGLVFLPGIQGHWYLRLEATPELVTTSLGTASGREITPWLPQGRDAQRWRQLLNEMQMLLFSHAVNQEREARGDLAVNSVWLHGGGGVPSSGHALPCRVYSDDASLCGMAVSSGAVISPFTGLDEVLAQQHAYCLVQASFRAVDADLSGQLWRALKARRLHHLELYLAWPGRILHVQIRPADLWKFWRKPKTIETYF